MKSFKQQYLLIFIVIGLSLMMASSINAASPNTRSNIAPMVKAAFQEADVVRVVVALRQPDSRAEIRIQGAQIAQAQQDVIEDVSTEEMTVIHQYDTLPAMAVEVTEDGLSELANNPNVTAVDLDMQVFATLETSIDYIGANLARSNFGVTGQGVNVAVLDTGVDMTHPDIASNVIAQYCFNHGTCPPSQTDESLSAQDEQGHGSHVAGIIASKGTTTPLGVAPGVNIVAVRVLNKNGSGWTSDVVKGIEWVTANRFAYNIKVINMSLGGGGFTGNCDNVNANTILYNNAIANARKAGLVVFAASGNEGLPNQLMAPACVSGVIAVGNIHVESTDRFNWPTCTDTNVTPDLVTCSSNSSSELDLLAPGAGIRSIRLGGGSVIQSGTSMSTPHAAGVAALMLQADPTLSPTDIETVLKESGTVVTDPRNGRTTPRIDAFAAVSQVTDPISSTSQISGIVELQGRTAHGGVKVYISTESCETATFETPITLTDETGYFEIANTPTIASTYQCLQVSIGHYLTGQYANPQGKLGTIKLLTGDVNADDTIDIFDISLIAQDYGSDSATSDLNVDNAVDIFDLSLAAKNYNQSGPLVDWE